MFWHDEWGDGNLKWKEKLVRLYDISLKQQSNISDIGEWRKGRWTWNFRWKRVLFEWKNPLLQFLMPEVSKLQLCIERANSWI